MFIRFITASIIVASIACSGTTISVSPKGPDIPQYSNPVKETNVVPELVVLHKISNYGFWLDSCQAETESIVNICSSQFPTNDTEFQRLVSLLHTSKTVILWTPFISYGPTTRSRNGYNFNDSGFDAWNTYASSLVQYQGQIIFWLADEPDAVAWGDASASGYNSNIYNDILDKIVKIVRSTGFNLSKIALNYSYSPDDLIVLAGLDIIGLESYKDDYEVNAKELLTKLSSTQTLWLLPRAFSEDSSWTDSKILDLAKRVVNTARTIPNITGILPFLYCIEASQTCNDDTSNFNTIGGGKLNDSKSFYFGLSNDLNK